MCGNVTSVIGKPLSIFSKTRYILAMPGPYYCLTCGRKEEECKCDRFCGICQNDYNVRLCADGNYYCKECRDACEYEAQS